MTTEHILPDRTVSYDAMVPRCPWCRDDISDLSVPLSALDAAWEDDTLTGSGNWLYREREFHGAEAACPRCGKGILLKFVEQRDDAPYWRRKLVIAPVMSEADRRYLLDKMGLF
ncbi:MAG: hypothetical protein K2X61_08860 [Caulobacteraceae bacterium]|nr:hypothetical protein [Caulobacteraceae bacterium]